MRSFFLFLLSLSSSTLILSKETVQCPSHIEVRDSGDVIAKSPSGHISVPSGFRVIRDLQVVALTSSSIFSGPPEEQGMLKPSWMKTIGRFKDAEHQMGWDGLSGDPRGVWVSCDYGTRGIRVVKPMPTTIRSCTAMTKKIKLIKPTALDIAISCET